MGNSGRSTIDEVDFHLVGPMQVREFFQSVQAGGLRITMLQLVGTGRADIIIWNEGEVILEDGGPVEEWLKHSTVFYNQQRVALHNRRISPAIDNRTISLIATVVGDLGKASKLIEVYLKVYNKSF